MSDLPPPGWYPDATGRQRWWDGQRWTEHAADQPPAVPYAMLPPRLDAGSAFSYAWARFGEQWRVLVPMVLIVVAVSLAGMVLAVLTLLPSMGADPSSSTLVASWGAYMIVILAVTAVGLVLQAGLFRAALAVTRGEQAELAMLVSTRHLGTYVGTVLLLSIAATVGYVLCIVPGLAVLAFGAFAPFVALDRGAGPVESIRRSVELVRSRPGEVLVVLLLTGAVYYVGSLVCYVGLLVSLPVALLMLAFTYRLLAGEPVA